MSTGIERPKPARKAQDRAVAAPFIQGATVDLRPIRRDDYEVHMLDWVSNREVTKYLVRGTFPLNPDQARQAYDEMCRSTTDIELCLVSKEGSEPLGLVGLHTLQWVPRSAEFRVLIGDPKWWKRGVGTEAAQLLVGYAFEVLNLNKVWLGANEANRGAVRSYEKCGFTHEGVLREEVYRNGRYYDVVRMSILRREYDKVVETWPVHPQIVRQFRESA